MLLRVHVLQTTKPGNLPEENEDACEYDLHSKERKKTKRGLFNPLLTVAVSDGATLSPFSSLWSQLLVEQYVKTPFTTLKGAQRTIAQAAEIWIDEVNRKQLAWYIADAPKIGSNATLLVVRFFTRGRWQAIALGDTCLFQIRKNKCTGMFPIKKAEEFGNTPPLISTHMHRNNAAKIWNQMTTVDDSKWRRWKRGDAFVLATDAMAQWLIRNGSLTGNPWKEILNLWSEDRQAEKDAFEEFVGSQRQARRMTEDDVTLVIVRFDHR